MDDQAASSVSPRSHVGTLRPPPVPAARSRASGRPGIVAAVYLAAGVAALALAASLGAPATLTSASAVLLPAGLALAVVSSGDAPVRRTATIWAWLLTVFAAACLLALATSGLPVRPYGDGQLFAQLVEEGRPVPRWLLGSAAAAAGHAALWELPPLRALLPVTLQSSTAFLAILCSLSMVIGTWVLFRGWPDRLSVLLPTLTPVWILFGSGYVEYYPLIAVPLVAALAWLFDRPLADRAPLQFAIVGALLPVLYVGFVPAGLCVLAAGMVTWPRHAGTILAIAIGTAGLAIAACWPDGLVSYFRSLYGVMNFGDAHLPPRYAGLVAGPASVLFSWDAMLSWGRIREALYLLVWGGGWWTLPLLLAAACPAWTAARDQGAAPWRDSRVWLGAILTVWHVYYLLSMVPRLGPTQDIDLYFSTYLTLAFMAGVLIDAWRARRGPDWSAAVIACAVASLACLGPTLVWFGLPPVP